MLFVKTHRKVQLSAEEGILFKWKKIMLILCAVYFTKPLCQRPCKTYSIKSLQETSHILLFLKYVQQSF